MIPLRIKITAYIKSKNVCNATLQNGNIIEVDPFVSCAIPLSDDEYRAGDGAKIVGKSFILTAYSVYPCGVTPHEGGMTEV